MRARGKREARGVKGARRRRGARGRYRGRDSKEQEEGRSKKKIKSSKHWVCGLKEGDGKDRCIWEPRRNLSY